MKFSWVAVTEDRRLYGLHGAGGDPEESGGVNPERWAYWKKVKPRKLNFPCRTGSLSYGGDTRIWIIRISNPNQPAEPSCLRYRFYPPKVTMVDVVVIHSLAGRYLSSWLVTWISLIPILAAALHLLHHPRQPSLVRISRAIFCGKLYSFH